MHEIWVIGGGLAGSEAAWQIAEHGGRARLFEMRPGVPTPAHQTSGLGELVCSNSFKSDIDGSAPHQLKWELRQCGSLLISIADQTRVPAGAALAVDRERFSARITEKLEQHPRIVVERREISEIADTQTAVIATGPLTSPALAAYIREITAENALYFYDAISPIVEADSIDWDQVFCLSRYGKRVSGQGPQKADMAAVSPKQSQRAPTARTRSSEDAVASTEDGDYVNCPMSCEQYLRFYQALIHAESVPIKEFEKSMYFEACLPVEELARRGVDTLRFGPMRPVGLRDPRSGQIPYAVVQLRQENLLADAFNLVGFQNHLKYGEQQRIFRLIPGLENAEFIRLGQIHRNTFINAPRLLTRSLQLKKRPHIYFAGQICGVEGYVESIAAGLVAGWNALRSLAGKGPLDFPRCSAIGSLLHYISEADPENFQPMNINFGLLPAAPMRGTRETRRARQIQAAREAMLNFLQLLERAV
jgi:methylenetetrahydrofolate--tRNA-(uracil-5-)-methyltransferase